MKHFWALPAFLRIALASPHSFSVFEDLLAFPQYEIVFPDSYLTEHEATSLLSQSVSRSTSSPTPVSQATQDLSTGKQSPVPSQNDKELELSYERVVLDGRRYLCSIPILPDAVAQNNTASAEQVKAEEEKELVRASSRGGELLDGMQGDCIYYIGGWWSYSFCYKDHVKQFHQLPPGRGSAPIYPPVEDPQVTSYVLGRFTPRDGRKDTKGHRKTLGNGQEEASDDVQATPKSDLGTENRDEQGLGLPRIESKGSSRYMVQRLAGGTECDLTGRERKIEVQFHCNPQPMDKIAMIKEVSTCSYLMIIYTPRLCNDVAFQPAQENLAHAISCQPVLSDSEIDAWDLARLEGKIRDAERLIAEHEKENPLRTMDPGAEGSSKRGPVIGGIEVGARRLVGGDGNEIEKGIIAGGGKETFLGTLATSDGKQMSAADLKKINIDPEKLDGLKRSAKEMAGKKDWKLDAIQMPQGHVEYRLIEYIDSDDNEEKGGKEKQGGKKKTADKIGKKEEVEEDSEEGSEEVYKDEL